MTADKPTFPELEELGDRRRTREEGIDFYAGTMAKAAMDCKHTLRDLREWFPGKKITFKLGYYADSSKPENPVEHEIGEPDIFVLWENKIACAIEVTGSDKISMPALVWIAKHKMEYAKAAKFPVAFALYYLGSRWFLPANKVRQWAAKPQTRTISGYSEYYHVIDPAHLSKFEALEEWVQHQIMGYVLDKCGGRICQVDGMSNAFAEDPSPY
jgi:hypothetical protein